MMQTLPSQGGTCCCNSPRWQHSLACHGTGPLQSQCPWHPPAQSATPTGCWAAGAPQHVEPAPAHSHNTNWPTAAGELRVGQEKKVKAHRTQGMAEERSKARQQAWSCYSTASSTCAVYVRIWLRAEGCTHHRLWSACRDSGDSPVPCFVHLHVHGLLAQWLVKRAYPEQAFVLLLQPCEAAFLGRCHACCVLLKLLYCTCFTVASRACELACSSLKALGMYNELASGVVRRLIPDTKKVGHRVGHRATEAVDQMCKRYVRTTNL